MLYSMVKNRHNHSIYELHKKLPKSTSPTGGISKRRKIRRISRLFFTEFRFIILTVLIVVAALTMQETVQEALHYYVRSRFVNPVTRAYSMFAMSFIVITVVIFVIILWKPLEEETDEPT